MKPNLVGRAGLARIIGCSEGTTRNLELRGAITPEFVVEGRPLYSVVKAEALRAARTAEREQRAQKSFRDAA